MGSSRGKEQFPAELQKRFFRIIGEQLFPDNPVLFVETIRARIKKEKTDENFSNAPFATFFNSCNQISDELKKTSQSTQVDESLKLQEKKYFFDPSSENNSNLLDQVCAQAILAGYSDEEANEWREKFTKKATPVLTEEALVKVTHKIIGKIHETSLKRSMQAKTLKNNESVQIQEVIHDEKEIQDIKIELDEIEKYKLDFSKLLANEINRLQSEWFSFFMSKDKTQKKITALTQTQDKLNKKIVSKEVIKSNIQSLLDNPDVKENRSKFSFFKFFNPNSPNRGKSQTHQDLLRFRNNLKL